MKQITILAQEKRLECWWCKSCNWWHNEKLEEARHFQRNCVEYDALAQLETLSLFLREKCNFDCFYFFILLFFHQDVFLCFNLLEYLSLPDIEYFIWPNLSFKLQIESLKKSYVPNCGQPVAPWGSREGIPLRWGVAGNSKNLLFPFIFE